MLMLFPKVQCNVTTHPQHHGISERIERNVTSHPCLCGAKCHALVVQASIFSCWPWWSQITMCNIYNIPCYMHHLTANKWSTLLLIRINQFSHHHGLIHTCIHQVLMKKILEYMNQDILVSSTQCFTISVSLWILTHYRFIVKYELWSYIS